MRRLGWAALCTAGAVVLAGQASAAVLYTVALTPAGTSGLHFNNLAQIALTGINDQGHTAGFNAPSGFFTAWNGINELDQSVGFDHFSGTDGHGALWSGGSLIDLGALPGASGSNASAINDHGLIVGAADPDDNVQSSVAVYWDDTGIHRLPRLTDAFEKFNVGGALDVNNNGLIVGHSESDAHSSEAVLWSGGVIQDLGHLGILSSYSVARAVNDASQIVGETALDSGIDTGFLWEDGTMTDLNQLIAPDPDGWAILSALDINNHGQILALERLPTDRRRLVILNPIAPDPDGWAILSALDINDHGQILALERLPTESRRLVILNPIAGGVPEPETWAMTLLGFIGLGAALRRQRPVGAIT